MFFSYIFRIFVCLCTLKRFSHSSNQQKNVLLIIVDDLRLALGSYGDTLAYTPNIDRLADRSLVFKRVFAQQALCGPSRNSILTSRRPDTLHLYDVHSYWRDSIGNFTTITQYFKSHGYKTYSFGKIFHPGRCSNFSDDFPYSWTNRTYHPSTEVYMNAAVCFDNDRSTIRNQNVICPVDVELQPKRTLPDIETVNKVRQFIKIVSSNEPFFIAVGLHKPHIPFRVPEAYFRFHDLNKFKKNNFDFVPFALPTVAFNPYNDIRKRDDARKVNITFPFGPIPKQFGWRLRQAYYAAVTYIDDLIGQLLANVNLQNTIVVLTSDHGWSLGEHAEWAKYSNYDVAVRVPLIIYSPNRKHLNRKSVSDVTELIDVFPTLVDLASLPSIRRCVNAKKEITCSEGKSLIEYFFKEFSNTNCSAISQYPRPGIYPSRKPDSDQPTLKQTKIMGYSIRTNQFRYTNWIKFNSKSIIRYWNISYGEELYDHSIDPNEMINLATRVPFIAFKTHLNELLKEKLTTGNVYD